MQKLVVDAPDKLEKGETFGPGGVRINGKMKVQYKNPEKLEEYMRRTNEAKHEKIDNRIAVMMDEFVWKMIFEGWERHGDKAVALFWDVVDGISQINANKNAIKALQIMERTKAKTVQADNAIVFQQKQQGVSVKNKSVC